MRGTRDMIQPIEAWCDLFLNGALYRCRVISVTVTDAPGEESIMTVKIPLPAELAGRDILQLQKDNDRLEQMVEDLNRRMAILMDT